MKAPRIVGVLAAVTLLYGAWIVEPRWITGALALLILYALLTNTGRAAALINQADAGLRAIIAAPSSSSGAGGGGAPRRTL